MRRLLAILVLACAWPAAAQETAPEPEQPLLAHVEQRGSGPIPMILIPSMWCDWSVYDEFMERNQDRYTMYAITLPGNGGTEPPPEPQHPDDFSLLQWTNRAADGIRELIMEESLEDVVLVGHYAGGQLAMKFAIEHPVFVSHVVSIDGEPAVELSSGLVSRENRTMIVNKKLAKDRAPQEIWRATLRSTSNKWVTNPGRAAVLADMMSLVTFETGRRYWLEMLAEDLTPRMRGLTKPALLIAPIPPDLSDAEADARHDRWLNAFVEAPDARILFFDDARSFVMYDEPEQLDEAIAEFLDVDVEVAEPEVVSP